MTENIMHYDVFDLSCPWTHSIHVHRGSSMSVHVILNLLTRL